MGNKKKTAYDAMWDMVEAAQDETDPGELKKLGRAFNVAKALNKIEQEDRDRD